MEKKNKKTLCNKDMNEFIMNYFYKNNEIPKKIEKKIEDLSIKEKKQYENDIDQLNIVHILFSLIDFVKRFKDNNIEKDKISIVEEFIKTNKNMLEYYNKYFDKIIKEKTYFNL